MTTHDRITAFGAVTEAAVVRALTVIRVMPAGAAHTAVCRAGYRVIAVAVGQAIGTEVGAFVTELAGGGAGVAGG